MKRCFPKNRNVDFLFFVCLFFSESFLEKGYVVFSWSGCLKEHIMFGKSISIIQQWTTISTGPLVCLTLFAGLYWASLLLHWFTLLSSLIFACHDFIEKNIPKSFWWCSGCFFLLQWTHADGQSLMVSSVHLCLVFC